MFFPLNLLLILFIAPVVPASFGFGYEQIKVLFFILSITLIGFVWFFGKHKLKWDLIKIASAVFILTLFITSILGINSKASFLGNDPYFQGWIVYVYLVLFSFLISVSKLKLRWIALALSFSSLFVSVVAIKDWILLTFFNSPVPTYAGRVVSTFGQPNFYAGFLLLTLPFSYFLFKHKNKKIQLLGWGSGLILLIGILVSYSRSTILMAFLLLILGLIDQLKIKFKAGLIVLQKPLTGYGLENISKAFSNYFVRRLAEFI